MSIPKMIHYCWFGAKPLPKSCEKILASWKKHLPDYEIMLWNEKTFDITECQFVQDAYRAGKYAFVSDYARLSALKAYGGLYFDTDLEVVRNFDSLLEDRKAVFGFESEEKIMTAFMAVTPDHPIIGEFLESYADRTFDASNLEPNTVTLTQLLLRRGLVLNNEMQTLGEGTVVYPLDYFQAYDFSRASLRLTDHTATIHRCFGSWCSLPERTVFAAKRLLGGLLSEEAYDSLKRLKKRIGS